MNCRADLSKMLTCNLRRPHRSMDGSDARRCRNPPGSGFICDLNGKIEYVVSKRVARSSSEIKLRCEPISMLPERIEGVACKWKINYDGNFEPQITLIAIISAAKEGVINVDERKHRPGQSATLRE